MSATPSSHDSGVSLPSSMNQTESSSAVNPPGSSLQTLVSDSETAATPICDSRVTPSQARSRGMSRSSSVPSAIYQTAFRTNVEFYPTAPSGNQFLRPTRNSTSSVRHLTCFWWKEKGSCRFTDDECLYAHHDTGHYTEPPRQLIPGEPALAGRKLDRAMRNLVIAHRSSGSLSSLAGSRHGSRPATPTPDLSSPLVSPPFTQHQDHDFTRLRNDNQFLKTMLDQSGKEKAVMINTIENLQIDNKGMKAEVEALKQVQGQLSNEREALQGRIDLLERQLTTTCNPAHPFGAIGRGRVNTETRCIGGLLDE